MKFFLVMLSYARSKAFMLAGALALLVAASYFSVFSATQLGRFVQEGLEAKNARLAYTLGFYVIGIEVAAVLATYAGRWLLANAALHTVLKIRYRLFEHLTQLPMAYFDRQALGRTVTRLTYDVDGLEDFFSGTLARLLSAILALATVLTALFLTKSNYGFYLSLALVPALVTTLLYRAPLQTWNREFARRNSSINAKLSEFLNGIPVIRAFGSERWAKDRFDDVVNSYLESAIKVNVLNSWSRPITMILCQLPLLTFLWLGGNEVIAGSMSLGLFVTFVRLCERLSRPVSALAQEIHTIQVAFASAERVSNFLAQPTEESVLGPDGGLFFKHSRGEIEFRNVSMAYKKEHPVLKNLSFKIQPGECIGLAGATGSGKTTTLALLARLYGFQEGEIFIDGHDIRSLQRDSLRAQLGYVSQDVVVFRGTLRENLSFGTSVSNAQILAACEKTGFLGLMHQASLNLESLLLDHGSNLSVGERQMLSLTRVLIKDPGILILDEATSNIDPELEKIVYRAIQTVMTERTSFIIAHRLRTLDACDRIFLFREGRIVESGSPDELLQQRGYYSQLLAQGPEVAAP